MRDDTGSLSDEASEKGKPEARKVKQPRKVAAKDKTSQKKAAKTAAATTESATMKSAQTKQEERAEPTSEPDHSVSAAASEPGSTSDAQQTKPEKPAEASVSTAAPPPSQPTPPGGTGLMGFWIKVGASVFVVIAGIVGLFSFLGDDEAPSEPEAAQAAATTAQDNQGSVVYRATTASGTAQGRVAVPTATERSVPLAPGSYGGYANQQTTYGGVANTNTPAAGTGWTEGNAPRPGAGSDQSFRGDWNSGRRSGYFPEQPAEYRPELYRPLEMENEPPAAPRTATVSAAPQAPTVTVPSQYPQQGVYAYPPAPGYGGYGQPPGTYRYVPAPNYWGYGR
jgi:hypothetical protein